jgi:septation ring formation regulator EzrA
MSEAVIEMDNSSSHLDDIFNAGAETVVDDSVEETQGLAENAEEANAEENVGQTTEGTNEEPKDELSDLRSQLESLKANLDAEKNKYSNAQSLIDRQGNEIGQLRKQSEDKPEITSEEYLNKFADDPVKAQKELLQAELERRESAREQQEQQIAQNRSAVLNIVPDFDNKLSEIKEWYKDKGASSDFVDNLNSQALVGNVDLAVALGEIVNLKAQLAETKSKNTNVINKLNQGSTVVSGKSGQSTGTDSTIQIPSDVTQLSDKQISELLKRA